MGDGAARGVRIGPSGRVTDFLQSVVSSVPCPAHSGKHLMPEQPSMNDFHHFVLDSAGDQRTLSATFLTRRLGTMYSVGQRTRGEYEVRKLVAGGMGVVVVAYNHRHRRMCALKTLREELILSKRARDSFERECRFWISLGSHPYVVRAYFTPVMSGRFFVAMEYIEPDAGGRVTLLDHITGQAGVPVATLLKWALEICQAMVFAHDRGLVCHRDLKPSNVLIDRDRTAKVTDFGTVKMSDASSTGLTEVQGTLPYMPPETLEASQRSDVRRDIWSVGVMLYQAIAGELPWFVGSGDPANWARCIRARRLSALTSPVWPILSGCLQLDRERRYASFDSLSRDLAELYHRATGRSFVPAEAPADTAETILNRAFSLHQLDRTDEAIALYTEGLRLDATAFDRGRLWHNLGRALRAQRRHSEAESCFRRATEEDPQLDRPWIDWAQMRLAQGDRESARALLARAKTAGSGYVDVWLALASFHEGAGDWAGALEQHDRAIKIDPTDSPSWWGKSKCLWALGRLDDSRVALRTCVAIEPMRVGIEMNHEV